MTDTPTPAMTPEQRAELVTHYTRGKWYIWNGGADCPVPLGTRLEIVGGFDDNWTTVAEEGSIFWPNVAAFRIDPPTSKLTAGRDAAQAEIARLTAENSALSSWQCVFTDGKTGLVCDDYGNQFCTMQRRAEAAESALATAREDGMREAANRLQDVLDRRVSKKMTRGNDTVANCITIIRSAIQKGAAT